MESEKKGRTVLTAYAVGITARSADIAFFVLLLSLLDVRQIGIYSFAMAFAAFAALALDCGINQALLREFSAARVHLRTALRPALIVRSATVLLVTLAVVTADRWELFGESRPAIVWAITTQILMLPEQFCSQWLRGTGNQVKAVFLELLDPLAKILLILSISALDKTGNAVLILQAITVTHIFIAPLFCLTTYRAHRASLRLAAASPSKNDSAHEMPRYWSTLMKMAGAFLGISLVTVAQNRADWLIISSMTGSTQLGLYSVANKVYEVFMMVVGIGVTITYPWKNRARNSNGQVLVARMRKVELCLGVAAALAASVIAPLVLNAAWGGKYAAAGVLVSYLVPVAGFSIIVMLLYYDLLVANLERQLLKIAIVATLLQFAWNILYVPKWGALGAVVGMGVLACSNVVGYSIVAVGQGARDYQGIARDVGYVTTLLTIYGLCLYADFAVVTTAVILFLGYLLSTWFVEIEKQERSELRNTYLRLRGA